MPIIKKHQEDLYRVVLKEGRLGKLHLDMNEGFPGVPESFVKRISSRITRELLCAYPEYKVLQKKVALHNKLKPENICLSNGSDAAIKYIFDAYVSSADKVLLTDPTFAMYPVYCQMFNAQDITVRYNPDLSFPVKEFLNNLSAEVKVAVVVNPNNPCGSVLTQRDLLAIIKKAADEDVLLIIDEAYFYFYPYSVIQYVKKFDNLVVLRTFSKLLGMASIRLGYAAASSEVIENIRKVRPTFDVNGIAVLFAEELLDNPSIIKKMIKETAKGKNYIMKRCRDSGIEHRDSRANFMLLNCRGRVREVIQHLAKSNILVNGEFRQDFLRDYIRVTIADMKTMVHFWSVFMQIMGDRND